MNENKQLSDVDRALSVLQQNGEPLYFRELINRVLAAKGLAVYSIAQSMSEIHTQINLDNRFVYVGKGMWGLSQWTPPQAEHEWQEKTQPTAAEMRRTVLLAGIQQNDCEAAATTED